MIKRGTVKEQLTIDSVSRKMAGLCPLMPEEVSSLITVLSDCSLYLDEMIDQSSIVNIRGKVTGLLINNNWYICAADPWIPRIRVFSVFFFPWFRYQHIFSLHTEEI